MVKHNPPRVAVGSVALVGDGAAVGLLPDASLDALFEVADEDRSGSVDLDEVPKPDIPDPNFDYLACFSRFRWSPERPLGALNRWCGWG